MTYSHETLGDSHHPSVSGVRDTDPVGEGGKPETPFQPHGHLYWSLVSSPYPIPPDPGADHRGTTLWGC